MFAWATPEYLLDHMSIEEVFYYYDQGVQCEDWRAALYAKWIGKLFEDKKQAKPPRGKNPDKPDKKEFYRHYGDQIERG